MKCLLMVLLFFLAVSGGNSARALDLDYLRNNREDLEQQYAFVLLEEDLAGMEIFLAGEAHGVAINNELAYQLLVFLHREAGVRYLVWEGGYGLGDLLNRYLQGGSEDLLELVFSQLEGSAWSSQEHYFFWKHLARFNRERPPEERIEVVGLDLELPLTSPVIYLDYLLQKTDADILQPLQQLAADFRELQGVDQLYSSGVRSAALDLSRYLQGEVPGKEEELQKILGDNWFHFEYVVESLHRTTGAWGQGEQVREDYVLSSLLALQGRLNRGPLFGQWGGNHVLQRMRLGINWLGALLQGPDSPYKGQVLSIYYVYDHCRRLDPRSGQEEDYTSPEIADLHQLRRAASGEITMFRLNAPTSPFNEELHFLTRHSRGVTTDYFQYIIMLRNQEAERPWCSTHAGEEEP